MHNLAINIFRLIWNHRIETSANEQKTAQCNLFVVEIKNWQVL